MDGIHQGPCTSTSLRVYMAGVSERERDVKRKFTCWKL